MHSPKLEWCILRVTPPATRTGAPHCGFHCHWLSLRVCLTLHFLWQAGRRHGSDGSENEWQVGVSPFDEQGKLLPGLLSEQDAAQIVAPFEADGTVMAYNFRLCVTQARPALA